RRRNRAARRTAVAAACRARRRPRRTTATTRAPAGRSRIVRADFGADPAPPRYRRSQSRATTPPRPTPRDRHSEPWNTPMNPPEPGNAPINPSEQRKATPVCRKFQKRTGNKGGSPPADTGGLTACTTGRLRPRHFAGRVVGPVAVEPDDAPLDAPAGADHAAILGDGIVDDVSAAVRDFDDAAAEAAWNGLRGPRAERGLADLLEIDDPQIGGPVHAFLLVEARGDPDQRVAVIARRQLALVFRAGEVEVHLQPVGGAGRCRRQRRERRSKPKSEQ